VWTPGRSDLCFATTNRQASLTKIAAEVDAMVVIGSENSSNTRALERLAHDVGCKRVLRVNTASELPDDLHGVIGVTAGASAPEELVSEVIARLAPRDGVREVRAVDEDEYFPPPRHIRELQSAMDTTISAMCGVPSGGRAAYNDHSLSASAVLAAL
jgi:4-hydroxy-3-methylbut-2-enyl diphosphate reductase